MNKSFKHILSLCLSVIMIVTLTVPCFAVETYIGDSPTATVVSETTRVLDKNDAISALMLRSGLSYNEAVLEYSNTKRGLERYEERHITYNAGNGWYVEVGCLVKVQCGGGHCNFSEVVNTWSKAYGSGQHTWDAFYTYATIEGQYDDTLRFQTRGNLEVATNKSDCAGFAGAGFSYSHSSGSTMYYRKTISINQTWTTGD